MSHANVANVPCPLRQDKPLLYARGEVGLEYLEKSRMSLEPFGMHEVL
jgi:hypothetical protein